MRSLHLDKVTYDPIKIIGADRDFIVEIERALDVELVDNINWWFFEKCDRPDYKMWDKEGNEIPTETILDLWNIVESNRI